MKLKRINIDGFRCLCDFELVFDEKLTLIVGENDSGKTSLINCLDLFTGDYPLDKDDFNDEKDIITISLVTPDFIFIKTFKEQDLPISTLEIKPSTEYIASAKTFIEGLSDAITPEEDEKLKKISKLFGLTVRTNSKSDTLITGLNDIFNEDDVKIIGGKFPEINKIQLDGKQFENVEAFFKEVFIKDKQDKIWDTKVKDNKTIKEIIQEELDSYSKSISRDLKEKGITKKLKQYLKKLTEIKVEPSFEPRSLNISSKVKFLEDGKEISVDKKGDGTKRRISLALLEYKADCEETCQDSKLYILDEPDTHLHVKAQLELLNVLKELADKECQVILTTHSPFLINAIKPKQIRLLYQPDANITKLRFLKDKPEESDKILRRLGIENIYLYFAKKIILVEGETEQAFFPRIYEKINEISLNSDLIKIINTKGINNIPGFSKALLELIDPKSIYVVRDNDASEETDKLISELKIPDERQIIIGSKEFEDAFTDEILFDSWKTYIEECGKNLTKSKWTKENIVAVRKECDGDKTKKFSKEIGSLNAGTGKKFTKSLFGEILGNYCTIENVPDKIKTFLETLKAN